MPTLQLESALRKNEDANLEKEKKKKKYSEKWKVKPGNLEGIEPT